jgi:hypothetical protein
MERTLQETMRARMEELKTVRDEIRLELKLASMDLRDEWQKLERRLPEAQRLAGELKDMTVEAIDQLLAEARRFRGRLQKGDRGDTTGATRP